MQSGPPATRQQLETAWATSVTHSSGGSLSIQMGSKGFSDDMAKRWSEWFKTNLSTLAGGNPKAAGGDVNFSGNELTSVGLSHLVGVFQEIGMPVSIFKLHKNMIESADALVEFLNWEAGCLKELHLSHNRLDTMAAKNIIVAAVFATDEQNAPKYPRRGVTPLWLRLENNDRINVKSLGQELKAALGRQGKTIRKTICEVDGRTTCNSGQCACYATPPALHLTYLKLFEQLGAGDASGPSVRVQQVGGRQTKGIAPGTSPPATPAQGRTLLSPKEGTAQDVAYDFWLGGQIPQNTANCPAEAATCQIPLLGHAAERPPLLESEANFPTLTPKESPICGKAFPKLASRVTQPKAAGNRCVKKKPCTKQAIVKPPLASASSESAKPFTIVSEKVSNVATGTTEFSGPRPMVVVCDYEAESSGYLSVRRGQHVNVWWEHIAPGDIDCRWPFYTFGDVEGEKGWLPVESVWERYVDDNGRPWIYDSTTGASKWEDSL